MHSTRYECSEPVMRNHLHIHKCDMMIMRTDNSNENKNVQCQRNQ